jgi:Zn-dependent protease with chaperone function
MIGSACWLVVLCVTFVYTAPALIARIHPAIGVRVIVSGSVCLAIGGLVALAAIASTWVAQHPEVAQVGSWSPTELRADDPFPQWVAELCGLLFLVLAFSTIRLAWQRARALRQVRAAVRRCRPGTELVVVTDERVDAFTTAGPGGRIVVTSGLLRRLSAREREVLLAHESSHLRHGHIWWVLVMDLAAAANPLLRRTARMVAHTAERWADEDAAVRVADRQIVARTLARTALLRADDRKAAAGLAQASGGDVPARVRAMMLPTPRLGGVAFVIAAVLLVAIIVAVTLLQMRTDALFDAVQIGR